MAQLQDYCMETICINGIDTYIISPRRLDDILSDTELLSALSISAPIEPYIQYAKTNGSDIFFAFAHFPSRKASYTWLPVNCYKTGNTYYHVAIRSTWLCRECKNLQHGTFIMPIIEHDPVFYSGAKRPYPEIPPCFEKKACENCGKLLQNHFLSL